ncbi:YgeY family selenium metabolism-linked hydrolase [Desulfotalea psychrophila]|uniref:Related to acetylornithine deacetylase n=1 Tax=Desulfotalea psychrophila (strain LSv54 / DSM 12343) TaxID=177439 RepID=Q6ANG0_DESPS|nr:YgeY family selenium metabolism-linked hydrolase [Desulfotalea psychrophila]CAG36114.1 related to acetylornithine deacetylase [Desulfotalea psychrophila LSv54]
MFNNIKDRSKFYAQNIYDFASTLIQTESFSGDEGRVAQLVAEKMRALDFDKVEIDEMGNVCGSVGHGPKLICVDAHMDVVGYGDEKQWHQSPTSGAQDEKNIYGRGAADMKASIASMLYAGKILKDLDLLEDFTYMVCTTVQEEPCEGLAWEFLIEKKGLQPDFVILAEPSNDEISLAQKGRMEFKISVSGLSAHASTPHKGKNAIYKMARIITELEQLNDNLEIEDPELGKGTLVVSEISAHAPSRCSVADYCEISIDRRLTWGESPKYALDQVKQLPAVQEAEARVEFFTFSEPSYTGKPCQKECIFPAWKLEKEHRITKSALMAYRELFAKEGTLTTWPFSTNGVGIMGKHQIPVIGYGPGTLDACHVPNEYVAKEQVLKATQMYAAIPIIYLQKK